jgi:uncharacterized protein
MIVAATVAMVSSQADAQQKKPSQAEIDTAMEIIVLKGANTVLEPLVPGVIAQNRDLVLQQNPALQKDLTDVSTQLRAEFAPRIKEVLTQIATNYATTFSEQELKDLLAFYKSPLGKKSTAQEGALLGQGMSFAQDWAIKLSDEVVVRMRAEMKKKGHDI